MSEIPCDAFGFERLEVWQKAVTLATSIYTLTKGFPREELYGLTAQIRRASVSVAANIAEGASRASRKEQVRFFEIAYGSLNEIASMLAIASSLGLVTSDELKHTRKEVSDICRMLSGLKRSAMQERQ